MAQMRLNRKGQLIPKNASQRKEQDKRASKRFRRESDHDAKKRPRHY